MLDRFFYHSFPRQKQADHAIGLQVLESMLKNGLLLTPEVITWKHPGMPNVTIHDALQIRICFTELSPCDLAGHAGTFGQFALEFEPSVIRELGAIPVFYVPNTDKPTSGFNGVGQLLVHRFAQIQLIVDRLYAVKQADEKNQLPPAGKDVFSFLTKDLQASVDELRFVGTAFQSLLFPAENLNYTAELGYYRQREWRIIENFAINNHWPFIELTPDQKAFLVNLNPFFQKRFTFRELKDRLNVDSCRYFYELEHRLVMSRVRRIIVPRDVASAATNLVNAHGLPIPVVALETIC